MKIKNAIFIMGMALLLMPYLSYCQYLQKLYDIDSSNEWGFDIFIQPDSSYLIFGTMLNYTVYHLGLFNTKISSDGNNMTNKINILFNNCSLYMGNPGARVKLQNGGYISPFNGGLHYGSNESGWCGLIKYNDLGDTIFMKMYTDTPLYFGNMYTCAVLSDGNYIAGGEVGLN